MSKKKLEIKVNKIFAKTAKATATTVVNIGGARSGKSYAMAQLLIMRAVNNPLNIAITRKTMPALKMTSLRLVLDLLKKYGLYKTENYNKTENYYKLAKSHLQFFSLDDPEKIKSSEFNYIWLEEANEFSYQDYLVLLTRLSAPNENGKNQIFLTLNPSAANSWIAKKLIVKKDVDVFYSTYLDNSFLKKDYIETLLSLKNYDADAYNVFALGKWGHNEKAVYPLWQTVEAEPDEEEADEIIWGLDFGFNNPSALVKIYIKDKVYIATEKLYQTGITTNALIEKLQNIIPASRRNQTIYADAAEPDRIAEIAKAGFNIKPAKKAVLDGIMAVKAAGLKVSKNSQNLIREIQNYTWKTTSGGVILEEPVKFDDHALDAMRYAIYSYNIETLGSVEPEVSFF
ncbi:MAG: PBSX family phage terminase large subunit [Elusimicrobiota bacterium]|jgi:phage terminase large subunit|nr:PBSX family phage terminase large subunit [Elusimicrobiota bacterium]